MTLVWLSGRTNNKSGLLGICECENGSQSCLRLLRGRQIIEAIICCAGIQDEVGSLVRSACFNGSVDCVGGVGYGMAVW